MLRTLLLLAGIAITHLSYSASPAPVERTHDMVVSAQPYATAVGFDILRQGGNAIDAAVAVGYALAVVHPCCGNIGGGGFMLIRFANGQSTALNFREKAPGKSSPLLYLDKKGRVISNRLSTGHIQGTLARPYLAVGVPGTVMGLNTALEKYGTLPLHKILAPAITLAEKGFILQSSDTNILQKGEESFKTQPNVRAIFLKNGHTYQPGNRLIQEDLAASLKEIARKGTYAFYQGKIADQIVAANRQNGGLITHEDLNHYTVEEMQPLTCTYQDYQLITVPPPSSGVLLCEALKILEPYPLKDYGFHSAAATHYITEAMRFAYTDRNMHVADPHFMPISVADLLSPSHIQAIRKKIKPNRASRASHIQFTVSESSNTTAYVVVDKAGNAVSVTYTINDYFGAKIIPGHTGFFLNNEMADFTIKPNTANNYGLHQGSQNIVAPNKRPLSSMAPTIITHCNNLFMVIGTPGGSTIPSQLLNVILNVIAYGMNIQEAADAPRFHMQGLPDRLYMEAFAFSPDTQRILRNMGYRLQLGSPYGTPLWGGVTGVVINPRTHKHYGAMDSRLRSGSATAQ